MRRQHAAGCAAAAAWRSMRASPVRSARCNNSTASGTTHGVSLLTGWIGARLRRRLNAVCFNRVYKGLQTARSGVCIERAYQH